MNGQSLSVLTAEQQDRVISNTVEAWQVLFRSVKERIEKELVSERIKRGIFNKKITN